ncbi:hypothetical protein N7513_013078 [Penicillium frequentans]|nr:hypothetical protein N7513_013078 [Penicillium glabrum]
MFKTKSQKIKQKQKQKDKERQSSVSSSVGYAGTKNSSSSTLPVQTPTGLKGAMDSTPSLVTPESKPEAPVLSEPEPDKPVSPEQAVSAAAPTPPSTPPLPQSAHLAPSEPIGAAQPEPTVSASVPASALASPPKQAPAASEPPATKPKPNYTAFVEPEPEPAANKPSPPTSIPTESRPLGGRRGKSDDDANGTTKGGELVAGHTGGYLRRRPADPRKDAQRGREERSEDQNSPQPSR